jgi:hypothetical protein
MYAQHRMCLGFFFRGKLIVLVVRAGTFVDVDNPGMPQFKRRLGNEVVATLSFAVAL